MANKVRVLILDDEPGIVRLCARILERAGYAVVTSTDPKAGITKVLEENFDILLVDIRMPGMDGFEVMTMARKHQPDIGVVFMTGFSCV